MRNQKLTIVLLLAQALPFTTALSFANFQQITSILIPVQCQLAYNAQIDDCTVADFNNGCSTSCQQGLNDAASDVVDGCATVLVSETTLLGIIKGGGQIAALCPQQKSTSSRVSSTSTTKSIPLLTSSSVEASVTIPTSGGVKLSTTLATSTPPTFTTTPSSVLQPTSSSISSTLSRSSSTTASTSIESSTAVTSSSQLNTITQSSNTRQETATASRSTSASASTSTSQRSSQEQASVNSGGGSPFDITAAASDVRVESLLSVVVGAGWAFALLMR
ncbi:hypothetical protein PVAG01_04813 [Phlyctema vagabunda]|uniref:Uncharacterized protein n=1 Tax=Phlyctema vagabunda TaxID=108571 RepID=A0ABR4PJA2_9HELO